MNDLPRGKRDETVTKQLLQPGGGGSTRAVSGVEAGGQGKQVWASLLNAVCMGFGKMEAADEDIGVEMGGDIQNAAVGTPADENAFSCFFDEQVLLMPEVVG